jgi:hypothetical protein
LYPTVAVAASFGYSGRTEHVEDSAHSDSGRQLRSHMVLGAVEGGRRCAAGAHIVSSLADTATNNTVSAL